MADSLASPVRVHSQFMKTKTFTEGKEHLHPFMQKDQKQNRLVFHRKDRKWTLYCGFFTTSDL